jgi:hypothetical protein
MTFHDGEVARSKIRENSDFLVNNVKNFFFYLSQPIEVIALISIE